jgi:hypothetical protein
VLKEWALVRITGRVVTMGGVVPAKSSQASSMRYLGILILRIRRSGCAGENRSQGVLNPRLISA